MTAKSLHIDTPFVLESGEILPYLDLTFHTYGTLNSDKSNVVWVCHALTANSDVFDWWPNFFGEGQVFNPSEHFVICANILGSHYGSSSPLSINPETNEPYFLTFPLLTVRDIVNAHILLANHLEIDTIKILIGGSVGGQQVLEWSIMQADRILNAIIIGCNAVQSPWCIAFNESQRLALAADKSFLSNTRDGGSLGLKAARSIALLSYRSYDAYNTTQLETDLNKIDSFKAASYQTYQGEKLVNRFNAYSYWYLTKVMDSHNVGRKRNGVEDALALITAKTLVIGVSTDILFPINEQQFIAKCIHGSDYEEIFSPYGHDGFLIETKTLSAITSRFLNS